MKPNREHAQKERDVFASNFRRILKLRGKTQSDIVSDLEITSSTVSDWANAKKYPRVDKMQALADYLGVVISDLREEPNTRTAPAPEGEREFGFDDFTYAMQAESKDLTEMDKQILLSMAKQLKDARKQQNGESG